MRFLPILALFSCACMPALAAPSAADSQAFLASHARMPGVNVRPSGLQVRILKSGFGKRLSAGDMAQIQYSAKLIDGTVIDGTSAGLPVAVQASSVLRGLGEALQAMREGDHWEVTLPPALAFGAKGSPNGAIPPDQALMFDVSMIGVTTAAKAQGESRDGLSFSANSVEQSAHWTIHP